ncbi:hypothetical protein D3C75_434720 [compost metagenome]
MDADVGNGDADLADRIHRGVGEGQGHLGVLWVVVAVAAATTGGQQGGQADQGQMFHGFRSYGRDNPTLAELAIEARWLEGTEIRGLVKS